MFNVKGERISANDDPETSTKKQKCTAHRSLRNQARLRNGLSPQRKQNKNSNMPFELKSKKQPTSTGPKLKITERPKTPKFAPLAPPKIIKNTPYPTSLKPPKPAIGRPLANTNSSASEKCKHCERGGKILV